MYNYTLINADTDSIMISKPDQTSWTKEEQDRFLTHLNSQFPEKIKFEHDGLFSTVIVVKAKNYVLKELDTNKVKIKGSSMRDTKREKKLLAFIGDVVNDLLDTEGSNLLNIYNSYIKSCFNINNIDEWCKKLTITEKVLNPERTNERKVLEALNGAPVQEGDKVYVFFRKDGSLCLKENFTGDYDEMVLVEKLYKTLLVFENIIDVNMFPKYHLKKNRELLEKLINE